MSDFLFQLDYYYGISGMKLYVIAILFAFLVLIFIYAVIEFVAHAIKSYLRSHLELKVLRVTLPRFADLEEEKGTMTQQQLAEKLSVGETLFTSIATLPAQKGFMKMLRGRTDYYSFEIVLQNNQIYFFVAIPPDMKSYVMQQIFAVYPNALVEDAIDYNVFSPQGANLGAELYFDKEYIFPINTYKKLDTDLLDPLTSTFAKVGTDGSAAIQFLVRSAPKKWRDWGHKTAVKASQGKEIKKAIKEAKGWGGHGLGGLVRSFFGGIGSIGSLVWEQLTGHSDGKNQADPERKDQRTLTQREQEMIKGIEDKAAKAGLEANLRIIVSHKDAHTADIALNNLMAIYSQCNIYEYGNAFKYTRPKFKKLAHNFIYREFSEKHVMILNSEEAATVFHFPGSHIETPNIAWMQSKKAAPPVNMPTEGMFIANSDYRGVKVPIFIKEADRRRHMYIIGMTGSGKSKFIDSMVIRDIRAGHGVCFIDPHGDDVELVLESIPPERKDDVIYFDPSVTDRFFGLNMLEYNESKPEDKIFVVNQIFEIFDKLYDLKATGGPMFEQYMKNACMLIMDDPESGYTLMEISRVLADDDYRAYKLSKCKTQVVKDFWEKEAQKAGGEASLANMVPYLTSKLAPFIANDLMRPVIAQQKTTLDFEKAMNSGKIILIKLSKGKIGDINANLLGMIIIGKILQAAFKRADMEEKDRKDFFLYIDEFQNFLTPSINTILSEARKYRLCLIIAHQLLGQLDVKGDETIKKTIFGNVGTKIAFRIGVEDAEYMAEEMKPTFTAFDFMNMPAYNAAIKLLIDNANPPAFSMVVPWVGDIMTPNKELAKIIAQESLMRYGKTKEEIEKEIAFRSSFALAKEPEKEISLEDLFK